MTELRIGQAVESRYKELGLTQELLASLAGVSLTTVQNVLHNRVGFPRTWPRLERALGWRDSRDALQNGSPPQEIFPTAALRGLYLAAGRSPDEERERLVRLYEDMLSRVNLVGDSWKNDGLIRSSIKKIWPLTKARLAPQELEPVVEAFRDFGWRGESDEDYLQDPWAPFSAKPSTQQQGVGPGDNADAEEAIASLAGEPHDGRQVVDRDVLEKLMSSLAVVAKDPEGVNAFRRLPVRVQQALLDGEIADAEVLPLPKVLGMSVITIAVRDSKATEPLTAEERRALVDALRAWHSALTAALAEISDAEV
jgi:transcriptional regulator with XRE-family HTH domain